MPSPSFTVSTEIHVPPDAVFVTVADLSKHGAWAANELRVDALDAAPNGVGKTYRSYAQARGRASHAALMD